LTLLLKDALGGNFKTKVLVTLKATETPALSTVLTMSGKLAQIHNYPIINDHMTQVSQHVLYVELIHFTLHVLYCFLYGLIAIEMPFIITDHVYSSINRN
jgi:hypothetical protein